MVAPAAAPTSKISDGEIFLTTAKCPPGKRPIKPFPETTCGLRIVEPYTLIRPQGSSLIAAVNEHDTDRPPPGSEFSPRFGSSATACWRRMVDRPKWSTLW